MIDEPPVKKRKKIPQATAEPSSTVTTKTVSKLDPLHKVVRCEVLLKEDPAVSMRVVEGMTTFCRSCFTILIPSQTQFEVGGKLLKAFENLTQQSVSMFHLAPNFCESCAHNILSLDHFKKLTMIRQVKFDSLLEKNDICKLHEVSEMTFKEEPEPKLEIFCQDIKEEPIDDGALQVYAAPLDENLEELNETENHFDDRFDSEDDEDSKKVQDSEGKPDEESAAESTHAQCPHCDRQYTKVYIEKHIATVHKPVRSKRKNSKGCASCGIVPKSMKLHRLKDKKSCLKCEFATCCPEKMERHVIRLHSVPEPCPICGKFIMKNALVTHLRKVHDPSRLMSCDFCSYTSKDRTKFRDHMNANHNPSAVVKKCELCDFTTASTCTMTHHIRKKHRTQAKTSYTCQVCGRNFATLAYVQQHVERIHERKVTVSCEICSKWFYSNTELK